MATITEDYISFETAKLLKEKGFAVPCNCYGAYKNVNLTYRLCITDKYTNWNKHTNKTIISCPTLQIVMKWLREVHNLSIEPYYDFVLNWVVDIKHIGKFTDIKEFEYIREKTYKSYEDACEAAIKYCLENLI